MSASRRAVIALALVAQGCVADRWVTAAAVSLDGAAPADVTDAATPDLPTDLGPSVDARCVAPDGGVSPCDCDPGQVWCDGACLAGPTALYRGEDDARDGAGERDGVFTQVNFAAGRFGRAFSFRGDLTRGYVTLPAALFDLNTSDFTLSLWFNTTGRGSVISQRATCWSSPAFTGFDVRVGSDGLFLEVWSSEQFFALRAAVDVIDGDWHFVAIVREGDAMRLSVDGEAATRSLRGGFHDPNRTPVYLGVDSCVRGAPVGNGTADDTPWFNGRVDEVALFRRALSADELSAQAAGRCLY